jgi:hypothetical protein
VNQQDIEPGGAVLDKGTDSLGRFIAWAQGGPFSHATMPLRDPATGDLYIWEMTWPGLRKTLASKWFLLDGSEFYVPLLTPLTDDQNLFLWNWWTARLGQPYDVGELLGLGIFVPWQRWVLKMHWPLWLCALPPLPLFGGVCSETDARAWSSIGLPVGNPLAVTPVSIPSLPFLGLPVVVDA